MRAFLQQNGASIVLLLAVILCVFLAVRKIIKNKKQGIGACGHSCADCPMRSQCDERQQEP